MKEQARNSRSAGIDLTKALAICAVPAQAALLLALSLGAYWVLRRIPVVNRWLI